MTESGGYIIRLDKSLTRDKGVCTVSERSWVGTRLSHPCWSVHGSGQVCSGSVDSRSRFALTGILEPQGTVSSGSNLPWRGYGSSPGTRGTIFRGMPTGHETFLRMPGYDSALGPT